MYAHVSSRRLAGACLLLLSMFLLLTATARAEQVQALFTFKDFADGSDQPINDAKVEIWRYRPRFLGVWSWGLDRKVWTDGDGRIDVEMPWETSEVEYKLRVFAANRWVTVWPLDTPHIGDSWYRETAKQTVHSPGDVLDFTFHFDDLASGRSFNIARAAWFAGEYMAHTYGGLDTVSAQTTDIFDTFYDPAGNTLQINLVDAFEDFTVAHEYGHYVMEQIGDLPWRPANHRMCDPYDEGLAWMEGFAHHYSAAVGRAFPAEYNGSRWNLEPKSTCDSNITYPNGRSIEFFVAASLSDLADSPGQWPSTYEDHDWTQDHDWLILSIVDHQLGDISDATIGDFRQAWIDRGGSQTDLDRILAHHGIEPDFNLGTFVSQSVPSTMVAGRTYSIVVTMKNSGSTSWSAAEAYHLGSQSPQDNLTWGLHRVPVPGSQPPGRNVDFRFIVTAPSTPGSYTFHWRMVQDGVEWFGDEAPRVQVSVTAAPQSAQFVAQSLPVSGPLNAGQSYPVSVTLRNSGETTWMPGSYFLGSQSPQDNLVWGLNRVPLPAPVVPGAQVTFNFNITAPGFSSDYPFQWRMLQNGVGWFGDFTPLVYLTATAPPPVCNATQCAAQCQAMGCRGGSCNSFGECGCLRCL